MLKRILFVALMVWLCTACASTSRRFVGSYDRLNGLYTNETVGFYLTIPERWAIYTDSEFAVPLQLRADQERVLEAYDPVSQLGLVVVVQEGPLLDIAELVRRMRAVPEARLTDELTVVHAANVRQLSLRATDMTGVQPVNVTMSFFIFKVDERYVYLTFSVPSTRYAAAQPTRTSILQTFQSN
jgi:hypothetical protein